MIRIPEMLMVGAAGRDAGKTNLICSVIERFSSGHPITGLKVTTVEAHHIQCPHHDGEGCGVCSALDKDFVITEEKDSDPLKDTGRMYAAGARRVLWLRARRAHLEEGVAAVLDKLGKRSLIVCESTSLRSVAEPGAFLIVKRRGTTSQKPSVRAVWALADRLVEFDGERFDISLDDFTAGAGRFYVKRAATAIVLAGGPSTRMKTDKGLLPLRNKPMIEHVYENLEPFFQEILVSANDAGKYTFLGVEVVPDRSPGQGPLMGIASSLARSAHDVNFVHACDIPVTDVDLLSRLLRAVTEADVAVPRNPDGQVEPLFAAYRKSAIPALDATLARGQRQISKAFELCKVAYLDLAMNDQVRNLNTEEDLRSYLDGTR